MKKRALVLGSLGMLGHEVLSELRKSAYIDATGTYSSKIPADTSCHKKFSVSLSEELITTLISGYDYVINCIAVLKSAINETNPESIRSAFNVNAEFPEILSNVAAGLNLKIIHISTDGVFSGNKSTPLSELTKANPDDVYGKSKLQGEITAKNVLNIRTSIIGRDPNYQRGLLEWFLKQPEHSSVSGYNDLWHGVTNRQMAELIKNIIEKDMFDDIANESSIHHFCPNLPVTKAQLLAIFRVMFDKDIKINEVTNPGGATNRTLVTCYKTLKNCYEGSEGIENALNDIK